MTNRIDNRQSSAAGPRVATERDAAPCWQKPLGWLGLAMAVPFFAWVPLALVAPIPSMIDVFGVVGLRVPASIAVGGLLLAAIGFHRL